MIKITKSEKETKNLAEKFARTLQGGEVILLSGQLGAGKTVFVKGLAEGLGIKEVVNSPTFVLMKIYEANSKWQIANSKKNKLLAISYPLSAIHRLVHVDVYRVDGYEDLKNIGFEDFAGRKDCVVVVEWGEKIKKLAKNFKKIMINIEQIGASKRKIIIK